jgi:hypothetical protein
VRALAILLIPVGVVWPALAFAEVPLRNTSVEASSELTGGRLRIETGERWRFGGYLGADTLGEALSAGGTAGYLLFLRDDVDVRLHSRVGLTRFGAEPTGWVALGRVASQTAIRWDHVAFAAGPLLESAFDLSLANQWRVSPGIGLGLGGGLAGGWPWLWLSADAGYSVGGELGGAVFGRLVLSFVWEAPTTPR